MRAVCPKCGTPTEDEAVVVSFISVWSKCEKCDWVWRSSLLQTVVGYAKRGVSLSRYEANGAAPAASLSDETPPVPVGSAMGQPPRNAEPDRVAEWLMSQGRSLAAPRLAAVPRVDAKAAEVEDMLDRLDPVPSHDGQQPIAEAGGEESAGDLGEAFYASFEQHFPAPLRQASSGTSAELPAVDELPTLDELTAADETMAANDLEPVIEENDEAAHEEPAADSSSALESSLDRALDSVEDLYAAFKRLEHGLGDIKSSCETVTSR